MTSPTTPGGGRNRKRANGDGTICQRADGRWEAAAYVLAAGGTRQRVHVYGRTRKEAFDKLTALIAASNRGLPARTEETTLKQYLRHWLDTVAVHRLRPTTHARYTAVTRLYIIPALGTKRLAKLTVADVRTALDQLRATCQCCARGIDATRRPDPKHPNQRPRCCAIGQCCGKRLSPRTVQYVHAVLTSALQHAVREELVDRNVARAVQLGTIRHRRYEPLTAEEAKQFLHAAAGDRLHALWELALRTGLRRGELCGLAWSDLDPTARTLTVQRTLQYHPGERRPRLFPTKTQASDRRLALPEPCLTALDRWRHVQDTEQQTAGEHWHDSGLIFTQPDGQPLDPTRLTKHFRQLLDQAGLRRIRLHDLRHSCATLLLDQGVELVVIKELLGHAHIGVTATVYAHVDEDGRKRPGMLLASVRSGFNQVGIGGERPA